MLAARAAVVDQVSKKGQQQVKCDHLDEIEYVPKERDVEDAE